VKRTRDPATCLAHSRDRSRLRREHALALDRRLVGIFGVISTRKHPGLVLAAVLAVGDDVDLLLAGSIKPDVAHWLDGVPDDQRRRIVVRAGYLPNEELDQLVACVDVTALAMTNNGPSGIMGKAWAAGVPVVSAGSVVRARELAATDNGEATGLTVADFTGALQRVLDRDPGRPRRSAVPIPTGQAFAAHLLGMRPTDRS
jgi:glycosyltransferase involved in cell wall biosynthesis